MKKSTLALVLMTLVSFANYVDRMLLSALAQPIKLEFGLSDSQLGLLTGFAFVLLYTITGVPLSRFADRSNKALVLAGALALWSLATAACGLAGSFVGLLMARVLVGIGEAGAQPIGYALLSDYFSPEKRATAIGWFLVGNSLGITAGFMLGGIIGAAYGWRMAFIAVGLPGVLLAIAVAVLLRKPPTMVDARLAAEAGPSLVQAVKLLLADRRFRTLLVVNAFYSFLIFGTVAWLPSFFIRSHGIDLRTAATYTGLAIGLGMAAGMVIGGWCSDRLLKRSPAAPQWFGVVTSLATGIAYLFVLLLPHASSAFVATFFAAMIGALAGPTNAATVQNVADPRLRATAASLATLTIGLLGIGFAPFMVGVLSDALAASLGNHALRYGLLYCLPVCLITAVCFARLAKLLASHPPAGASVPA
jgi:predicted MFS family arabinose efflux permease